jgi:hypothetical protein
VKKLYHILKTRVNKIGKPKDYINLPVTNRLTCNTLESKVTAIGIVTEVIEYRNKYELSITLWDRFVSVETEYSDDKPSAFSISIL